MAVHTLGIPHPTGYPLYVLLGKGWQFLFPVGELAWRLHVFSALWGVVAALLLFGLVREAMPPERDWEDVPMPHEWRRVLIPRLLSSQRTSSLFRFPGERLLGPELPLASDNVSARAGGCQRGGRKAVSSSVAAWVGVTVPSETARSSSAKRSVTSGCCRKESSSFSSISDHIQRPS